MLLSGFGSLSLDAFCLDGPGDELLPNQHYYYYYYYYHYYYYYYDYDHNFY